MDKAPIYQQKEPIIPLQEENSAPQMKRQDFEQINPLIRNLLNQQMMTDSPFSQFQVKIIIHNLTHFFKNTSQLENYFLQNQILLKSLVLQGYNPMAQIPLMTELLKQQAQSNGFTTNNLPFNQLNPGHNFKDLTSMNPNELLQIPDSFLAQNQLLYQLQGYNQLAASQQYMNPYPPLRDPKLQMFNELSMAMPQFQNFRFMQDCKEYSDAKIKRKHIKKQHNPDYNTGHWTQVEHQMYVKFLDQYREIMESPEQKKTNKIFKLMSDTIKTRSPSQCRSHHQKFNPYSRYIQNNIIRRRMKTENGEISDAKNEDALKSNMSQGQLKIEGHQFDFQEFKAEEHNHDQSKNNEQKESNNQNEKMHFNMKHESSDEMLVKGLIEPPELVKLESSDHQGNYIQKMNSLVCELMNQNQSMKENEQMNQQEHDKGEALIDEVNEADECQKNSQENFIFRQAI